MGEAGYKKLIVWQKANELAYQIYLETKKALGSVAETEYLLDFSLRSRKSPSAMTF